METLALCKMGNETYGIEKGSIYKIDIYGTYYDLYLNKKYKHTLTNFDLNLNHFDLLRNEVDFIDKIKQKLSINDNDILLYQDISDNYKYWIRYNEDIISISLEEKLGIPCIAHITITSNNHMHEVSINNYMTDGGIDTIINQINFIYE